MPDDPISSAFRPLLGLPLWSGKKGHGSMMSFEFGEPRLQIREPIRSKSESPEIKRRFARRRVRPVGEWFLFIYMCEWRVTSGSDEIAHSESSDVEIEAAVDDLDGQRLVCVEIDPGEGRSRFRFDLGSDLLTWPVQDDNDEQWWLHLPDRQALSYRADGWCWVGPADQPEDEQVWRPLGPQAIVCSLD